MNRKEKLLAGIDVRHSVGLEIGALCRPFLQRKEGAVIYVDHADTATLRAKYANHPDVDLDKLVEVDAVWGSSTLKMALEGKQVDYIVASHVIEHVPDLIGWLGELRSVLRTNGEVRLIVPDKRFEFDYLRRETQLADVLYSYLVHARIPQPHIVLEFVLNASKVDCAKAWRGRLDETELERHHTLEHAMRVARDVIDNGAYHDVHCWVFTPKSFARLFVELALHDLIDFKCTRFHDTELDQLEFFIGMRPCADRAEINESWRGLEASLSDAMPAELRQGEIEPLRGDLSELDKDRQALIRQSSELANTVKSLNATLAKAQRENEAARRRLDAIARSRSWRMTGPLRSLRRVFKRAD